MLHFLERDHFMLSSTANRVDAMGIRTGMPLSGIHWAQRCDPGGRNRVRIRRREACL